jgi:hypothetical protein
MLGVAPYEEEDRTRLGRAKDATLTRPEISQVVFQIEVA